MVVIGLDFGNYNSYPSFVNHIEDATRLRGNPYNLVPDSTAYTGGIPSVYLCLPNGQSLLGVAALNSMARSRGTYFRYLKRNIGKVEWAYDNDGNKTIKVEIDKAITAVIEHCVRLANDSLKKNFQVTTNKISLAYPSSFTSAQRKYLISLAEKATLDDGTPVEVFGTIAEPAAAALDYLSDDNTREYKATVLTYDLGGGTFDAALVAADPDGKINKNGQKYYYDILDTRGIPNIGGYEFDKVIFNIMKNQIPEELSRKDVRNLRNEANLIKEDLSNPGILEEETDFTTKTGNDYLIKVTRKEFEEESKDILMKTINLTKEILTDHPNQQPDLILLSGGASQMPMVKETLEKEIPQYKDKIKFFRPELAISYGAARFGTVESNNDSKTTVSIQKRVEHDIGLRFYKTEDSKDEFIHTVVKAGTPIPVDDIKMFGQLYEDCSFTRYDVYEAKCANPNESEINRDWINIMEVRVESGRVLPKGSRSEVILNIDKLGNLMVSARDLDQKNRPYFKNSIKLKNLSTD